jgi:hypothetical protein
VRGRNLPDDRPVSQHPVRVSVVVYGLMAAAGFGFLLVTGQSAWVAALAMAAFFVAAVAWSWWRFRARSMKR